MGSPAIFKKKFLIAIGFGIVCIKSCETKNQEAITHTELLTSGPWKRVIVTASQDGKTTEDHSSCLYTFKTDETLVSNAKHCGNTKWSISSDGKILLITKPEVLGGAAFPYEVEMLTANTLKLKRVLQKWTITEIYTH